MTKQAFAPVLPIDVRGLMSLSTYGVQKMNNLEEFRNACRAVVANKEKRSLAYAVGYASAGLALADARSIQVQCLYILNNMTGWRGPVATECRGIFKRLSTDRAWKGVAA